MPDSHPLVCRFGAFGDMVMITPLLRQLYLRSGLPCDVLAIGSWNKLLFEQMPYVRNVMTIDSRSAPYWFNRSQREMVRTLKSNRHRFVWVCETSNKSYRLLARAGINQSNSVTQLELPVIHDEHYCAKWLRLGNTSPPGFSNPRQPPEALDTGLFVSDAEKQECRGWLKTRGIDPNAPIICIQTGSKRTSRRGKADRSSNTKYWPKARWAEVIAGVIELQPNAQVILCGVPAELETCRAVESICQSGQVHTVADDLPLRRLLALLSMAHSCISVDTGPAHAAAALNCPLVVLFGKASPNRFRPVSANSPVETLLGLDDAASTPDIGFIKPSEVLSGWRKLG